MGNMKRFPVEHYASLELNQVQFPQTRAVISQLPLAATFTEAAPCENGMVVAANKGLGELKPIAAVTDPLGLVYTSEKEYGEYDRRGLKHFRKVGGDYARVGVLSVGDTWTSNCFQYDDAEFEDEEALDEALAAWKTTAVYAVPVANSAVLKLTATAPATGAYARVCKYYSMPNGEKGIKVQLVRA